MNPISNVPPGVPPGGPPGGPPGERRPGSRASSSSLGGSSGGSIRVGRVGQLVRQRSNYDFGVARVASLSGSLAETVRPSGERQQRSVTELELAVLAPSMLVTLAERPEQVRIEAVFYQPGQELRTLVVEGVTSAEAFEVTEDHVVDVHPAAEPTERLLQLDHRGRHTLLAREGLLHAHSEAQGNCRGLENLAGARIDLLPHQLRAAQRVLSLPTPRALLGDEVGLGKTIECGMVLSVLFRHNPGLRVLVLCPGQLCLEWLGELYSRFHARVFALVEHLMATPAELPNQPRLIASFGLVQQSEPLQKVLVELPWDVVVVDEAHRLPASSPLFAFVRELATRSPGLLLLSATPTPARPAEYTRLVSLLDKSAPAKDPKDPKDPKDAGRLDKLRPLQQQLAALAAQTEKAAPQALPALAPRWLELLGKDEQIQAFVADFARKPPKARAARASLLRHVAEWYGLDSRVIRSRRDHLGDLKLPARTFTPLSYTPSEPESRVATLLGTWCEALSGGSASPRGLAIGRYLAAHALQLFASSSGALAWLVSERRKGLGAKEPLSATLEGALDLPMSQPETRRLLTLACRQLPMQANEKALLQELDAALQLWQKDEPRLPALCRWISGQLEKEPAAGNKMLVFVEQPETLQALQPLLATELTRRRLRVAGLHAGMAAKERERAAHNFTHSDTTAVLLCDQLGGEGRGFAAAGWVIHADLPWDLGLIEQRIGRLERLGREQPVRVLAIASPHFVERGVSELVWQHAGLGDRSLAGLQFLAEELRRELVQHATTGREGPLSTWLATARTRIEGERLRASEAQDPTPVFDRHRFDTEEAQELIDELVEDSRVSFPPLSDWAKKTGIVLKSTREPDVFDVDIGGQTRPVIELRPETLRCTIDRGLALGDPSLQFLTWGHPLIEALLRDASTYSAARCTHVVHEDLEGRTWRGCRVRVIVQANPAHLAGLPAALQGLVGYVAQRMEETVFVRADGEIEPVARQKEFLERAFSRSHNPDLLALAADERAYRQFAAEVRTAAQAGLDHVKSKLVPIFTEPADELAEDPDLLACRARMAVTDPRLSDEPRRLAADLVALYEKALASIREPLIQIDNIAFLDIYPAPGSAART